MSKILQMQNLRGRSFIYPNKIKEYTSFFFTFKLFSGTTVISLLIPMNLNDESVRLHYNYSVIINHYKITDTPTNLQEQN